jgi:hypothetical protein
MDTLLLVRGRSDRRSYFRKFNLLNKIVRFLKFIFTLGKAEEKIQTEDPAVIPETHIVSRTYNPSKELKLRHSENQLQREDIRRKDPWSVIERVNVLLIKKFLSMSQWRVVFEWRGPPRAVYVEEVFAHL